MTSHTSDCRNVRAVNTAVCDSRKKVTSAPTSSTDPGANSIVPYDGPATPRHWG
ncbi:hypothetical protein [Streptomyces sp. NPDC059142]|uniref:hypothetical protein n=1 Tax=Streptomyces sp. NPDC059142 TaxID=3346739 RepID=UPI00369F4CDE